MIGGGSINKQFYEKIKSDADKIPNLEFIGFIPYPDIGKYFNAASILINTSNFEGFSNTFLQAWMAHTPVISLNVNPDEIICRYKLGFHSKTFEQMVKDVKTLLEDGGLREKMGENGKIYVEQEHNIVNSINKYHDVFEKLHGNGGCNVF